jgi:hypothetical protein
VGEIIGTWVMADFLAIEVRGRAAGSSGAGAVSTQRRPDKVGGSGGVVKGIDYCAATT